MSSTTSSSSSRVHKNVLNETGIDFNFIAATGNHLLRTNTTTTHPKHHPLASAHTSPSVNQSGPVLCRTLLCIFANRSEFIFTEGRVNGTVDTQKIKQNWSFPGVNRRMYLVIPQDYTDPRDVDKYQL